MYFGKFILRNMNNNNKVKSLQLESRDYISKKISKVVAARTREAEAGGEFEASLICKS